MDSFVPKGSHGSFSCMSQTLTPKSHLKWASGSSLKSKRQTRGHALLKRFSLTDLGLRMCRFSTSLRINTFHRQANGQNCQEVQARNHLLATSGKKSSALPIVAPAYSTRPRAAAPRIT